MIEKQMLDLHVAFLARVLNVNGNKAKIQPIGLMKEIGGVPKEFAPISSVPITNQARHKLDVVDGVVYAQEISDGDVVVCVCCDRDITESQKGISVLPPPGHHTISDCIIVGIL